MKYAPSNSTSTVTLNLFQGPFIRSSSVCAARWMLKQVQHDGVLAFGAASSLLWSFGPLGELKRMSPKAPKDQRVSGGLSA